MALKIGVRNTKFDRKIRIKNEPKIFENKT